jgi:glycosyltransferase involved in cell wall biosynthesis
VIDGRLLVVVVPAFQEERLIDRTLDSIPDVVDRVIVVDDASTDGTVARVEERGESRVQLLPRPSNGGVGASIAEGYRAFLAATGPGQPDALCVVMAADAQMDPQDLPALLHPILHRGADYAKGNRLATHDVREVMPRTRFLGNIVFTLLTKVASGYWHIMDSQCGYTAITRSALERVDLDDVYPRYGFPNDFLVKLNVAGLRVADVPVRAIYGEEESGIRAWRVLPTITLLLIRGFWWRLWKKYVVRDFHPLVLLYVFGTLLSVIGVVMAAWITYHRFANGLPPTPATSILTALFLLMGFQSVLFAMMFDMLHNQDLKVPR